jgi:hypothetical protein
MAKNRSGGVEVLLGQLFDRIAESVAERIGAGSGGGRGKVAKSSKANGRRKSRGKLDMTCRVAGCKNRSRGPRFGFICDEHSKKLSQKEKVAAREAWNKKA